MSAVKWFTPYDGVPPMQLAVPIELFSPPKKKLFPARIIEHEMFGDNVAGRVSKVHEQ
jgi:hypothetical protein